MVIYTEGVPHRVLPGTALTSYKGALVPKSVTSPLFWPPYGPGHITRKLLLLLLISPPSRSAAPHQRQVVVVAVVVHAAAPMLPVHVPLGSVPAARLRLRLRPRLHARAAWSRTSRRLSRPASLRRGMCAVAATSASPRTGACPAINMRQDENSFPSLSTTLFCSSAEAETLQYLAPRGPGEMMGRTLSGQEKKDGPTPWPAASSRAGQPWQTGKGMMEKKATRQGAEAQGPGTSGAVGTQPTTRASSPNLDADRTRRLQFACHDEHVRPPSYVRRVRSARATKVRTRYKMCKAVE